MNRIPNSNKLGGNDEQPKSVVDSILSKFFAALDENPEFVDISSRLKTEIIEKKQYSETALRRALFGETPS